MTDMDVLVIGAGVMGAGIAQVAARRGQVSLVARRDDGTPRGAVFIPFAYQEAAANLMTNAALDPLGKIQSSNTAQCG